MVFETAREVRHPRRRQRRRNGIARIPVIVLPLEAETQPHGAVEPFPVQGREAMHHGATPLPGGGSPPRAASAVNVAMTTSRTVSRNTMNQYPEAMWHHHSYFSPG